MNDLDKIVQAWADGLGAPASIKASRIPNGLAYLLQSGLGYLPTGRQLAQSYRRLGWERTTLRVKGYRGAWNTKLSNANNVDKVI